MAKFTGIAKFDNGSSEEIETEDRAELVDFFVQRPTAGINVLSEGIYLGRHDFLVLAREIAGEIATASVPKVTLLMDGETFTLKT